MDTNLELARKQSFQLMVENLRKLAEQFEAHRAYVTASAEIFTGCSGNLPDLCQYRGAGSR